MPWVYLTLGVNILEGVGNGSGSLKPLFFLPGKNVISLLPVGREWVKIRHSLVRSPVLSVVTQIVLEILTLSWNVGVCLHRMLFKYLSIFLELRRGYPTLFRRDPQESTLLRGCVLRAEAHFQPAGK